MKIVKHGFVSPKSESMFRYNAWPTVITLPDGTLLAGWSGDRLKHICPFGKVLCARSLDGGYTWLPPYTVQDTVLDDRDAGLCAVGDKILMTSFTEGREIGRKFLTHWLHAPENGAERDLITAYMSLIKDEDEKGRVGPTLAVSGDGGYTFTPPVWVPVTSPHGPTLLSNGEILFVGSLHRDLKNVDRPAGIYAVRLDADCRVLLCAHMDEIGFRVTHITDEGLIQVQEAGSVKPALYLGAPMQILHERTEGDRVVREKVCGVGVFISRPPFPSP